MVDDAHMLLALLVLAAAPKVDARVVGTWNLEGQPFLTLKDNGTGVMEGDGLKWRAEGGALFITDEDGETDKVPYRVDGDALSLTVGGMPLSLKRGGKAVAKASKLQRAAEKAQGDEDDAAAMALAQAWLQQQQQGQQQQQPMQRGGGQPQQRAQPAGNDQLSRLLLSSNWCWLRYSNGNSYTQKVHFEPNGTWQDFSESDIYVNNQYAQTVSQATGNRSGGGQWQVRGGQLWLSSSDSPQLAPVELSVTRNSNGSPIINADGREYYMCN